MSTNEPNNPDQPVEQPQIPAQAPEGDQPAPDEAIQPPDQASPVLQPDPQDQQVEPLPAPADVEGNQPQTETEGPGLSPAAHNPDLLTDDPDSAPSVRTDQTLGGPDDNRTARERITAGETPPPANEPGNEATGTQPAELFNDQAVQCPVCQHRFVPDDLS